jgi:GTPase SAR1 family protein
MRGIIVTQLVPSPLESFELMRYAIEVPCFICDGGNRHDAQRCRHCYAPLALTYQVADNRSKQAQLLAVLGPRGAGKTSYLGMLCDNLSRRSSTTDVVSRGAFSVALQQQVIGRLADHHFPNSTEDEAETWNWNHLELFDTKKRRVQEVIFPDMAGSVLDRELEHQASPFTRALLKKCSGAIILLDAERIERGDPAPDFFAMKLLSYLGEFGKKRGLSWRNKPIAFLFTKTDCSQACTDSPRSFAEQYTPGTYRQATSWLKRFEFFATSVAGAAINFEVDGTPVSLPLRVEPHGTREPMDWLLKQLA